ncbi:hypothetical protein [cf. Phormidesmis sp. LEGE 11477]|uniref:hypothetical protein n=1 Tax=cf. Phormidesmis sp. LEGE 11477 TaxID=1828680 RepID=UPI0018800911|nr:hypothetical protein [cf. Phormidesmis sp. LEGE 11477]MBE9063169.1 hypothetical protein [cf. Phormidesmis sp. LEGE 11477]
MASKRSEFRSAASNVSFFLKGAGAGLIVFLLVGGAWQVTHFWWVMAGTSLTCGCVSAVLHLEFQKTLTALMDNLPWI